MIADGSAFRRLVQAERARLIDLCAALVRINSENPPGDTRAIASTIIDLLRAEQITAEAVIGCAPCVNVLARVAGAGPGPRLVFNGHLDTAMVGDAAAWSVPPVGGVVRDERLWGRGVADMKAGVAAAVLATIVLAQARQSWCGEVLLALTGDEGSGGRWGTTFMLEARPETVGDIMICGDAGAPEVIRFGEKGYLFLDLAAYGRAGHGAHIHLGVNANERLIDAVLALKALEALPPRVPDAVAQAVAAATPVSERFSGAGEGVLLLRPSVNVGAMAGGTSPNQIPDQASAKLDIRIPPGYTVEKILDLVGEMLAHHPAIRWRVLDGSDPTWTDPAHPVVVIARDNGAKILGERPVVNMRLGYSDARLFRQRGVASIVCGPRPYNHCAPDENVTLRDLFAVFYIHATTAYDYLATLR